MLYTMSGEIFFSCILLVTVIIVYQCVHREKINKLQALAFGVLVSAAIEISQLILMRGLFGFIPPTGLWWGLFFYILKEYYFRRRK